MHYGESSLNSYMGGGSAFGQAPSTEELKHQVIKTVAVAGSAYLFSTLEGYQYTRPKDANGNEMKDAEGVIGGEIKIAGKIPLNLLVAAGAHAAAFYDVGESVGIDADYLHAVASGALAVWSTNRGHEMGMKMRKDKINKEQRDKLAAAGTPNPKYEGTFKPSTNPPWDPDFAKTGQATFGQGRSVPTARAAMNPWTVG